MTPEEREVIHFALKGYIEAMDKKVGINQKMMDNMPDIYPADFMKVLTDNLKRAIKLEEEFSDYYV